MEIWMDRSTDGWIGRVAVTLGGIAVHTEDRVAVALPHPPQVAGAAICLSLRVASQRLQKRVHARLFLAGDDLLLGLAGVVVQEAIAHKEP